MLKALADGETNPAALAALAHERLRATPEQLCDALGACTELKPVYRRLLKMTLEHLQILEQQIDQLDQELATLLHPHQDAVQRLAEVPGFAVDSAQQIIAEVGPAAATFPSEKCLSSWVGACPGEEESAGVNYSHRSPKGNRHMRRLLNQTANAAVKAKGSIFEIIYRRCVPRLGHNQAIGVIAHRQCHLIWLILHQATLTKNGAQQSPNNRGKSAQRESSANCEASATGSNHPILSPAKHKRSDFRAGNAVTGLVGTRSNFPAVGAYQESRYPPAIAFPPHYVRDDSARAHVKDKRERYAENRNNQHGLLKASARKVSVTVAEPASAAARCANTSLNLPVSSGPRDAPHMYMAIK